MQGWGRGAALAVLPVHTQSVPARTGTRAAHGCLCATLPGQAQMRQPDTLKQMMFLKWECKLGHAWTEPEGHGCAAGARGKALACAGCGGLHIAPRQPPLKTSLFTSSGCKQAGGAASRSASSLSERLRSVSAARTPFLWLLLLSPSPTDL